eukprot:symbB.v1.2.024381.t1/scaffold2305.1/size121121/4
MSGAEFLVTADVDFLPKEEAQEAGLEAVPVKEEAAASTEGGPPSGGDTGGSGDDDGAILQRKLNEVLVNSRENRKSGGKTAEELQEQLNAAFHNSKEARKDQEMYAEWMQSQTQYRGRIRSFSEAKGFGFIDCAETMQQFGRDVFVHKFQLHESGAWVGQEVLFEVELNKTGQPQARNMMLANPAEAVWDYSNWYDNNMQQYGYGDFNSSTTSQRSQLPSTTKPRSQPDSDPSVSKQNIEDMIRQCNSPSRMQEIIEQYGQHFLKRHVVTALYQLGLCRQHDKKNGTVNASESGSLTRALIDRLVHIPAEELAADEAANVLWALAALEEAKSHRRAYEFAFQLGMQAKKRYMEFSPSQMATFVSALSRLVQQPSEDELVCQIVTQFSEYSSGNGSFSRFPPEELKTWTNFLQEASQPSQQQSPPMMQQQAMGMGMPNMGMGQMGMRPNFPQGMGMNNANGMNNMGNMGNMGNMNMNMGMGNMGNMGNMNMGNMGMGGMGMGGMGGGCGPGMQQHQQRMGQMSGRPMQGPAFGANAGKGMKGMSGMSSDMMQGKSSSKGDGSMGGKPGMGLPGKGMSPSMDGSLIGNTMKAGLPGLMANSKGGKSKGGDMDSGDKGFKGKGGKDSKGKGKGKDMGGSPGKGTGPAPLQPGSQQS